MALNKYILLLLSSGQIDGQEITTTAVLAQRIRPAPRRPSPPRRMPPPPPMWRRTPPRMRRRLAFLMYFSPTGMLCFLCRLMETNPSNSLTGLNFILVCTSHLFANVQSVLSPHISVYLSSCFTEKTDFLLCVLTGN